MTAPAALPARKPPNLLIGFVLNVVFPCAGCTYLDEPGKALDWTNPNSQEGAPGAFLLNCLPLVWLGLQLQLVLGHQHRFGFTAPATMQQDSVRWRWIVLQAMPYLLLYAFLWQLSSYPGG